MCYIYIYVMLTLALLGTIFITYSYGSTYRFADMRIWIVRHAERSHATAFKMILTTLLHRLQSKARGGTSVHSCSGLTHESAGSSGSFQQYEIVGSRSKKGLCGPPGCKPLEGCVGF